MRRRRKTAGQNNAAASSADGVRHFSASSLAAAARRPLIVFLSGDGLSLSFEHRLAAALSRRGFESSVIRALHFFWKQKTPAEVAAKIDDIIKMHVAAHDERSVILVGYSFGGAIAPFAISAMPAHLRERIAGVALLAPALRADFAFSVRGWVNMPSARARDVNKELRTLCAMGVRIVTILGEGDAPRAGGDVHGACRSVTLPGGHSFNKDFERLADIIEALDNADQAATADITPEKERCCE